MVLTEIEVLTDEGFTLRGHQSGSGERVCVGLHGGPGGYGADYIRPLHELAGPNRRVVTFDQLGTGRSDIPRAPYTWTMKQAALDVDAVRRFTGAETVDVVGHSYGGVLGLQYVLDLPQRVDRLVLSNTAGGTARLEAAFEDQVREVASTADADHALAADAEHRHDDPVFQSVMRDWLARFFTNGDLTQMDRLAVEAMDSGPAGLGLWGASLWTSDGALKGWDIEDRLASIAVPTLAVHGGNDTSSTEINRVFAERIPDCEWLTMSRNGHGMFDEPNHRTYLSILASFLTAWPLGPENNDAR